MGPHASAHDFGRVGIDASIGEKHRLDARRQGGPKNSPQVSRITDAVQDKQQRRLHSKGDLCFLHRHDGDDALRGGRVRHGRHDRGRDLPDCRIPLGEGMNENLIPSCGDKCLGIKAKNGLTPLFKRLSHQAAPLYQVALFAVSSPFSVLQRAY